MTRDPALVAINEENRAFWRKQKKLFEVRMNDDALRESAFETLDKEIRKGIPVYYQTTLEQALSDAERTRRRFSEQRACKAGKVGKADTLNALIRQIVRQNPGLTEHELLEFLRCQQRMGVVEDIDEETQFSLLPGTAARSRHQFLASKTDSQEPSDCGCTRANRLARIDKLFLLCARHGASSRGEKRWNCKVFKSLKTSNCVR
jgi:hypothetical protein